MKLPIKYGALTALGLIVYFVLMKLLGLETNFLLRIFNFVFIIAGIYAMYRVMYNAPNEGPSYFAGLGAGVVLTVTAVLVFLVFLGAYVTYVDPSFMQVLEDSKIWGADLELVEITFAIFVEGLASGLIISFGLMQYFKNNINSKNAV